MKRLSAFLAFTAFTLHAEVAPEPMNRFAQGPLSEPLRAPFAGGKFALGDGATVVFAGGTNFVREAKSGALESLLATRFAERAPRFRSMAVEADTVYEQARGLNFGTWTQQLDAAGATVVIAQFGQMEALDGRERLLEFTAAYHKLLDQFSARTQRLVLVSPMPFEKPPSPHVPDLTSRNSDVRAYTDAVREIAKQRGAVFVDLFAAVSEREADSPRLTDNGIHLTADGLTIVSAMIAKQLGVTAPVAASAELRGAIAAKNRLWAECWRPANWAFVYGDRNTQLFGSAAGGQPSLKEAFEQHRPLIAEADARIASLARGEKAPPAKPEPTPVASPPALTPEEELATFTAGDGYEVQLFASERDGVVKPIQISWDERGRMFIACSPTYPHLAPGAKPGDFILVCEDTDGDGRADKSWKFAEGLNMVEGVEPGDGGVYVCDYDELVHLRDTDGDGRADQRRVLFSGFGTGDTHQLVNSISHGDDGSLWFTQGLHINSHLETPWGLAKLDQSSVWRLRPRTLRLDGFFNNAKAGHNCWGVAVDDWGQVFHKSGDRPDGYYTVPGMVRAAAGFVPDEYHPLGSLFQTNPKTTAIDFVGSRALPDDVQGCAVIGGFMGGVVELHRLIDDGSGFRSEQLPKLLRSTSTAFRPVDVSQGPDGAIYVCDFFNPIIGHYQASYRDPNRDKAHGRIWRISAKGRPPVKQPNLAAMSAAELLEQLRSPERWTRSQAQSLLFSKPENETVAALDTWAAKLADEPLLRLALGIYEAHETARPALLARLLAAKDARVRAYATRMTGAWSDRLPNAVALLRERAMDADPRVRLEAIVAATYVAKPEAVEVAALASAQPRDKFIDYALAQSIRALKPQWQPALASLTFGGDAAQREFVIKTGGAIPPPAHPGKAIFDTLCLNCHQADAKGLAGIYPPLAGSEWITGEKTAPIKMLLHGMAGPITVKGEPFGTGNPIPMPPSGLDNQQIADVLTYVRASFGNAAAPITAADVQTVREQHKDRTILWSVSELAAPR